MGYMAHHAIVATGMSPDIDRAHAIAVDEELACRASPGFVRASIVSPLGGSWVNDYRSFLIAPDGSKEGWPESDEGDALRARIIARWRADCPYVDWVLVRFGGDDYGRASIGDHVGQEPA